MTDPKTSESSAEDSLPDGEAGVAALPGAGTPPDAPVRPEPDDSSIVELTAPHAEPSQETAAAQTDLQPESASRSSDTSVAPDTGTTQQSQPAGDMAHRQKPGILRRVFGGLWTLIRGLWLTAGVLIFAGALAAIGYVAFQPWIDRWWFNQAPDVNLPTVAELQALSPAEREQFRRPALQLANFRPRTTVFEQLPLDSETRPVETGTHRLYTVTSPLRVDGTLRIYRMPNGRQMLRLTDFAISAGYDLRLVLSPAQKPRNSADLQVFGYVDLTALKGEQGEQNYLLPQNFEINDFDSFLIHDRLFDMIWAVADLN